MDRIEILEKLDKGQIDFDEALDLLRKQRKGTKAARGYFLKIAIKDEGKVFPVIIPLFLLKSSFSLGKAIIRFIPKDKRDDKLEEVCRVLDKIDGRDIKRLVDELGRCKAFPLVRVEDGDTFVEISII